MENKQRHLTGDGVLYAIKTGIENYYNFNGSPVKNSERIEAINQIIEDAINDRVNFFSCSCTMDKETGNLHSVESVYESAAMLSDNYSAADIEFESKAREWFLGILSRARELEN